MNVGSEKAVRVLSPMQTICPAQMRPAIHSAPRRGRERTASVTAPVQDTRLFCPRYALIVGLFALLLAGFGFSIAAANAQESPRIRITDGNVDPLPIAIPDFSSASDTDEERDIGARVAAIVAADLERSGLFDPIEKSAFIERNLSFQAQPRFGDWRLINAKALVTGQSVIQEDGRLRNDFFLWDPFQEDDLLGLQFFSEPDGWRRVGHLIADAIYERMTGEKGYFDTRIVFVSESGPKLNRTKQLAIMDQDGANVRYLTDGGALVIQPRFSPTAQQITYMSYAFGTPRVFLYDLDTGRQEVVGDFPGMTFAPRFSPDGERLVFTLANNGNSDVHVMDLRTRRVTRLTSSPFIDTEGSFSPDGKELAFTSDRSGSQEIYVMDLDGGDVRRISFGEGTYGTPVWSPRGDLIAFTKIFRRRFYIGVMRPDGSGERVLTSSYHVEAPTWAPNGRVLMYFREGPSNDDGTGGEASIWSVDLTGRNERQIPTPGIASDPAWSPSISNQKWDG